MSLKLRRAAVVSLAALALSLIHPAVTANGPDGGNGFRGGHEPPMHFGPFEIPKFGSVSGGFSWGLAR